MSFDMCSRIRNRLREKVRVDVIHCKGLFFVQHMRVIK